MARSGLSRSKISIRSLAAASLIVTALVAASSEAATARPDPARDESVSNGPVRKAASNGVVDLATATADRWIVQLDDPSVASRGAGAGTKLNVSSADNVNYREGLEAHQEGFKNTLRQIAPHAKVERTYQVALNGLAVKMSAGEADAVRRTPGVRAVTPDISLHLDMYATPEQIGAPTLWNQVGGQGNAGAGVKVAVIDSGIYVTRDAGGNYAGNPCFNDTGYQAPRGYPKGDTRFTNNKVIVARAYFRPDDPPTAGNDTPIQGPGASPHGTHTAGTVACDEGTSATISGVTVQLSGVAPHAYLMNYRVFYPSQFGDDFQSDNAYVAELVQAIDDAVADGADVISNSWGASYQNTLAWPDPMVQAAEAAVDAGVVMVFANGNAGPDEATSNAPANSPKVIGVGAVTKNATIVSGAIDVTAPAPVPAALVGQTVGTGNFGPQITATFGPAPYIPAEVASGGASTLGCAAFPAGSMTGAIALIERGACEFSTKVLNAQNAGAIAALVYNSAANGDNLQSMGPGAVADQVTIPSWFMRRSQGQAMRDYALANPSTAQAQFTYAPQTTPNIGDVMAGFSSRGPTTDKTIKPDVVAPGVDVVSSGYATGNFPANVTGFGSASGTSMATPHVAGAAALLVQLHPRWTPGQVKSALMTTATEKVFLNTTHTVPAGVLDRGSGRIDLTRAGNPGITLDQPSISGGEHQAGQTVAFKIKATDVSNGDSSWAVSSSGDGLIITPSSATLSVQKRKSARLTVQVGTAAGTAPGNYEGEVVLTNSATGEQLHVPIWLGVRPLPTTDVLLVDDDASGFGLGLADYGPTYKAALTAAGVSFDYLDVDAKSFPANIDLYKYRAVVMFTGDNTSFDFSGLFPGDQNALNEWLDSGGRAWVLGQNEAEATDSNASFSSPNQGRSRLFHGYLGLRYENGSIYGGAAPNPTATGAGFMRGVTLDLSPNGDGIDNQTSIEGDSVFANNDTFQAADTMTPLFLPIGSNAKAGTAISFSRGSEPSLEEERVMYRYRTVSMGFGLEGVNGAATQNEITSRTLSWLLDEVSVTASVTFGGPNHKTATFNAPATSSTGAAIVQWRWDFGDHSPVVTTTGPSTTHDYTSRRGVDARVEVTDSLGHRSVVHIRVARNDDNGE
jgi:subtilisin family serine protease